MEQWELSLITDENEKWHSHSGGHSVSFLKAKDKFIKQLAVVLLDIYLIDLKFMPHENLNKHVYYCFMHNCQKMEATKMAVSRRMDQKILESHPYIYTSISNKKK